MTVSPARGRIAVCLLVAAMGAASATARADVRESEASIQRGVELRRARRNAEALVEFQKAFALDPTPRARAQIALALQALGDWLGAEHWLNEALEAKDDAWIEHYKTELLGALATVQTHLGSLRVSADAGQGEILVNGAVAATLPATSPIRVVAGPVDVVVRSPGRADAHQVVDVPAGGEAREDFHLAVEAPRPAPASPPPHESARASSAPLGGYVALGGAAALAIGGIVAWTVRQNAVGVWNDDSRCLRPGGGTRAQQCGAYQDTANAALGVEIGAFSAAVVSAGIGAWLLLHADERHVSAARWCAPTVLGASCGGEF